MTGNLGDIDGDGKVDHSDLLILKRLLASEGMGEGMLMKLSAEERARLDVNGDGKLSYEDVVALMQTIAEDDTQSKALADKFNALRSRTRGQ